MRCWNLKPDEIISDEAMNAGVTRGPSSVTHKGEALYLGPQTVRA